jgi:hypothetical protein
MMNRLRAMHLDEIILAAPVSQPRGVVLARWLRPKRIIGFGDAPGLDVALPVVEEPMSEAEDVFRIARLHGIEGPPPPCHVPRPAAPCLSADLVVAIHISARKPSQRWPVEQFFETMRRLHDETNARFVLLWSPGATDNPLHPGDDQKAQSLMDLLGKAFPVVATPTRSLKQLIAALAGCNAMICTDGGAMQLDLDCQ